MDRSCNTFAHAAFMAIARIWDTQKDMVQCNDSIAQRMSDAVQS